MATKVITEVRKPDSMDRTEWERVRVQSTSAELRALGAVVEYELEVPDQDPDAARLEVLQDRAKHGGLSQSEAVEHDILKDKCRSVLTLSQDDVAERDELFAEQLEAAAAGEHLPMFCADCGVEEDTPFFTVVGGERICADCTLPMLPLKQERLNELAAAPTQAERDRYAELRAKRTGLTAAEATEYQTLRAATE